MTDIEPITLPPLVTVPGVDLLAAGTWRLFTGTHTFTPAELAAAVEAQDCPAVRDPIIKLGHFDPRYNPDASDGMGTPAVGRVTDMGLALEGNKITANLAGMPGWLAAIMPSAFPNRSIEGEAGYQCSIGHVHPFVITALALLGVTPPAVGVLGSLEDLAALYGVTLAASSPGRISRQAVLTGGDEDMAKQVAAAVSVEDVRNAFYAQASPAQWIATMTLAPPQLIVCDDASNKTFRVPIKIGAGGISFGDAVEVEVEYADVPAAAAAALQGSDGAEPAQLVVYASAEQSREGLSAETIAAWSKQTALSGMGDSPSASAIKAMFAIPHDTKTDSKLPHHDAADGRVGAANMDGVHAAMAALNGGRGGLTGESDAAKQAAYSHLKGHYTSAGETAPDYAGAAGDEPGEPLAAAGHGSYDGRHTHAHPAMGTQGDDAEHEHEHEHHDDGVHDHHQAAAGGGQQRGATAVDFTEKQEKELRAALGLKDDEELTPELVMAGLAKLSKQGSGSGGGGQEAEPEQRKAASLNLPPGAVLVEQTAWDELTREVEQGKRDRKQREREQRDEVIAAAISEGKFPKSRAEHWARLWNADADGTRQVIAGLRRNVVPVDDIGLSGSGFEDADVDEEYRHLFPPHLGVAGQQNR